MSYAMSMIEVLHSLWYKWDFHINNVSLMWNIVNTGFFKIIYFYI